MKRRSIVVLWFLVSNLFLSSCSPLKISNLFPNTPKNNPYQINTFPISGKYIQMIGSSGDNICYYSYDMDKDNKIIQNQLDIVEFNFKSLDKKTIYTLPTENQYFLDFQNSIIGVSYSQLEEPILFLQKLEDGVSNIYSVNYQQKHLLYSQKSSCNPLFEGFFYKPNHKIRFNYLLLLYPLSDNKMKVVVDSIENGYLQTIEIPKADFNWYETENFIWFISKSDEKSHPLYKMDKQSFSVTKVIEYPSAKIVGIDYTEEYILINNEIKNTIEIVNPEGVVGSIPCNFPQENIDFVVSKKFQNYYSFFILQRTTVSGLDTKVPWIRYFPKTKKIIQKEINLPENFEIYASKYYERKNDEFIALGVMQKSRDLNLIFYYFEKGKIALEPLSHRVDQNMTIKPFSYLPGYYFSWSEYTKMEKFSDFNYQIYYCSLNRLQDVVDQFNKKP
jgi:hypothetical protein